MSDIRTVVDWLTDGARSGSLSEDVLAELCQRMVDAGIPLWRAAVFVNTLHPDVIGRAFIWQAGTGVKVSEAQYDILETDEYRSSPVVAVYASAPSRCAAVSPTAIAPTIFRCCTSCGPKARPTMWRFRCCSPTARSMSRPGPPSSPAASPPEQFADLESIIAPLTRVAEIRALRRTATNLLNTYVGRQAGERILPAKSGAATSRKSAPRSGSRTCAASPRCRSGCRRRIWSICSTAISTARCRPILEHGGEVLKFIGDGLLAIFPLTGDGGSRRCLPPGARLRARGAGADRCARHSGGRGRRGRSASGSRCTSAR